MDCYTSESKNQAVEKCREILGEHFKAFSIITLIEGDEDSEPEGTEGCFHHYDGGFWTVLGMLTDTHTKMSQRSGDCREEEE